MKKLLIRTVLIFIYSFALSVSTYAQNNEEILKTLKQEVEAASAVINTKPPNEKEIDKAIEQLEVIRKKSQTNTDKEFKKLEALVLRTIAMGYSAKFSPQKSLDYYLLELPLQKELGEKLDEGKCLVNIGLVYYQIGNTPKALDVFNSALPIFVTLRDKPSEMNVLRRIGVCYKSLGEYEKALKTYVEVLEFYKQTKDQIGEAKTLNSIGVVYINQSKYKEALELLKKSAEIYNLMGDKARENEIIGNLGTIYSNLHENKKALEYYEKSLKIYKELKDKDGEAMILGNIGMVYVELGENLKALNYLQQALLITKETSAKKFEMNTLNSLGIIYGNLGETQKALNTYNEILALSELLGDRDFAYRVNNNLGILYTELAEYQKAIEHFEQALKQVRILKNQYFETWILNSLGVVYTDIKEFERSRDCFEEAMAINNSLENQDGNLQIFTNLGRLSRLQGNTIKSEEYSQKALELAVKLNDKASELIVLDNLTVNLIVRQDKKTDKIQSYLNRETILAEYLKNKKLEAGVLRTQIYFWKNKSPQTSILFGKIAINLYQQLRSEANSIDKISSDFIKDKEKMYRDLASLLLKEKRFEEAQEVLSLFKDGEFYESFQKGDKSLLPQYSSELSLTQTEKDIYEKYQQLAEKFTPLMSKLEELKLKGTNSDEEKQTYAKIEEEAKIETEKFTRFLNELPKEFENRVNRLDKTPFSEKFKENLQILQTSTKNKVAAVYTLISEENYQVLIVTPTKTFASSYPIKREELLKKINQFRNALKNPSIDPKPLAGELYEILFKPIAKELEKEKADTLMWSLDSSLRYVPVAALFDSVKKEYLVQQYRNTLFTNAFNTDSFDNKLNQKSWRGLGIGVSEAFNIDVRGKNTAFAELLNVLPEVRSVVRQESEKTGVYIGKRLENKAFTLENFNQNLDGKYQIVHIASHFYYDDRSPLESFLLLGDGSKLELADLRKRTNIFEGTELLTLSACETANGGVNSFGKEIEGLAVLAQRQGAKSILATLWRVEDSTTGKIMSEFYEKLSKSKLSKAEALRQAQLKILLQKNVSVLQKHPFYWASYTLVGDWR
jgi:CHAT domain-containing protein/tetratricopeptide (TPR) repeat protein